MIRPFRRSAALALLVPFLVLSAVQAQVVEPLKPVFTIYEKVEIRFGGVPNVELGSVGVAPPAWPDNRLTTSDWTAYARDGIVRFQGLAPGQYEARLFFSSDQVVRARATFQVIVPGPDVRIPGTDPQVAATKPVFGSEEDVSIRFSGLGDFGTESVAVAPVGWPDDRVTTFWFTSHWPGGEAKFGRLPPGRYEARIYFSSDQVVRARSTFEVALGAAAPAGAKAPAVGPTGDGAPAEGAGLLAFDMNEDGFLSGKEIRNCDCAALDTNGDGMITATEMDTAAAPAQAAQTAPAAATGEPACTPGERVEVAGIGGWSQAVVVGTADDWGACLIQEPGGEPRRVASFSLRLPGSTKEAPVGSSMTGRFAAVPDGVYACLQSGWDLALTPSALGVIAVGGSRYENVLSGQIAFDPATQRISWQGGSLDGYRAVLMQDAWNGKPLIKFAKADNQDNVIGQGYSDVNCYLQQR